ncbi:alpha/beta hydrolase [Burkholderia sp. AU30198]|uniref:alpha/beta fold hydrolase n=1 Tax=Burkholderia sp. AU30198 TaxID=2879627 RepID=UPI001CF3DFFB|nr:alpha/beta hydrolase [Burkholderia sp. AU30198]MCA8298017.1 alpha/beta hydrolase [Burkholderia sp. AU30198]
MQSLGLWLRRAGAALAFLLAFQAQSYAAPAVVTEHSLTVNGIKLHYLEAGTGNGTPIVLLAGYGETSHMWLPLMPKLATNHVVIAPDLPGAGASDIPAGGYDKKTMAQDIHALVQALGFRDVEVVGHDIGLMVAYAYAAQYRDEARRLVLMDSFLPGVGNWQQYYYSPAKWHFAFYGETPLKLVQGRERIYLDHFWNDFAANPDHSMSEADRALYTSIYAQPGRMRAGFEWFHAFPQDIQDFQQFAKTPLQMPVLVLIGQKAAGRFTIDQVRVTAANVQGEVIEGAGHWLMSEAPDRTMGALVTFLNAGESRSR